MIKFDLWTESFIFIGTFSVIIIIPCICVAVMGYRMITRLGVYPTRTPIIQMSILLQLIAIEVITFACLMGFYSFFAN